MCKRRTSLRFLGELCAADVDRLSPENSRSLFRAAVQETKLGSADLGVWREHEDALFAEVRAVLLGTVCARRVGFRNGRSVHTAQRPRLSSPSDKTAGREGGRWRAESSQGPPAGHAEPRLSGTRSCRFGGCPSAQRRCPRRLRRFRSNRRRRSAGSNVARDVSSRGALPRCRPRTRSLALAAVGRRRRSDGTTVGIQLGNCQRPT